MKSPDRPTPLIFGKPRKGESREAFKKRVREALIERGVFSGETGKLIGPEPRQQNADKSH